MLPNHILHTKSNNNITKDPKVVAQTKIDLQKRRI